MARFLALDGDTTRFQLLSANVKGDSVRLEQSLVWDEDQPINKNNAAAIGERLRAKLREAGIAPAPLLICLGRDRIIVKELKVPKVPLHEEPALVRFQSLKELTEGGDDAVIDYVPIHSSAAERRVQIMAVRKDLIAACRKIAEVAGLKLATVSPRPFAILAGLRQAIALGRVPPPGPENAAAAVLVRGDKWGEFAVIHGGELTISRSLSGPPLTNDSALLGEIRRNLAVHTNQNPEFPVRALYLAEPDTPGGLRERLQDSLAIPVHAYEPAIGVPVPDGPTGGLAGPAGLFALKAAGDFQINFIQPRQPKPPKDSFKKVLALTGAAALTFLVVLFAFSTLRISAKKARLLATQKNVTSLQKQLKDLEPESKRIKALDEWNEYEVNWLDELYDMTARMDKNSTRIHLVSLDGRPADERNNKAKFAGYMQLKFITKTDLAPFDSFIGEFVAEKFNNVSTYEMGSRVMKKNTSIEADRFPIEVSYRKIDLHRRTPDQYKLTFSAEAPPKNRTNGGQGRPGFPGADFMLEMEQ